MVIYTGNVKKLADSIKSDETAISKLKDEEKNKLEVQYLYFVCVCDCVYVSMCTCCNMLNVHVYKLINVKYMYWHTDSTVHIYSHILVL